MGEFGRSEFVLYQGGNGEKLNWLFLCLPGNVFNKCHKTAFSWKTFEFGHIEYEFGAIDFFMCSTRVRYIFFESLTKFFWRPPPSVLVSAAPLTVIYSRSIVQKRAVPKIRWIPFLVTTLKSCTWWQDQDNCNCT